MQERRSKQSEGSGGQEFADYWAQKDELLMQSATAYKSSLLDYGIGAAELLFGSTYNLGVITGSGFRGLYYATTEGTDAGVNAIQQSQAVSYEYRSEGAKAILAGISNSETVQTVGRHFNSLKTNTGDFYYEQLGPFGGAVGSVLPDFGALAAGPKVVNGTFKAAVNTAKWLAPAVDDVAYNFMSKNGLLLNIAPEVTANAKTLKSSMIRQLIDDKGSNFATKVYLELINKTTGQAVTIITDGLSRVGNNSFEYEEAKFSGVRDLSNSSVNLRSSFTKNQKLATDWLSEGNAIVKLKNSQGGRYLFGKDFEVGKEINLSPKVNVYVNSPNGLVKRTYP